MNQSGENPVESRRAFRALFADSGLLPPGKVARGVEREEAFTRLCINHRGAELLVKGVRFGSGVTKRVRAIFRSGDHPEETVIEVRLPVRCNPQVHCRITGKDVHVLKVVNTDGELVNLGALHNQAVFAVIDAGRRLLPHHQGDLWFDIAVTDGENGAQKLIFFGVRTTPAR
ncbi:hypothetical protein EPO33_03415 [Patescibacteria group bacterium]|nr:MAG: hypothetical protein EPO33_03415 [Patescibacteria group bacterium]